MQISIKFRDNTPISNQWKKSFLIDGEWRPILISSGKTAEETYNQLLLAERSLPEDQVLDKCDAIIGNNTWTHHSCECCKKSTREPMIHLGHYDDYESGNITICKSCLSVANKINFEE